MTIPSEVNDSYFFEKYNKIWKKIEELMGINFERKPPFSNNITCTTKIKTLSPCSEDYQDIKIPRKEIISFHLLLFYILLAKKMVSITHNEYIWKSVNMKGQKKFLILIIFLILIVILRNNLFITYK